MGDAALIIHLDAGHDGNGNPRRVYVILDAEGFIVDVIDEGYSGRGAIREYTTMVPAVPLGPTFATTAKEYRSLLKYGEKLRSRRSGNPGTREEIIARAQAENPWTKPTAEQIRYLDLPQDRVEEITDLLAHYWELGLSSGFESYKAAEGDDEEARRDAAFEIESHSRDYSPFEFLASEINSLDDEFEDLSEIGWKAYDDGIARGIDLGVELE